MKSGTQALIFAAQEQVLQTIYIKCKMDRTVELPLCRLCKDKGKSVYDIISECRKQVQRKYKRRHDEVANFLLCGKHKLPRAENWWEHEPQEADKTREAKILWDVKIQCDHQIEQRKPHIVIFEIETKSCFIETKSCFIIDMAIQEDQR